MANKKQTPVIDDIINDDYPKTFPKWWFDDMNKTLINSGGKVAVLMGRVHQDDIAKCLKPKE